MNYTELQAEVVLYLNRTDLTDRVPMFVDMAESVLFRELNARVFREKIQVLLLGELGSLSASAILAGSVDFVSHVEYTLNGVTYTLDYHNEPVTYSGDVTPHAYRLEDGGRVIRVFGAQPGTVVTVYIIPKFLPLTDANPSNWILENAPDLYLFATCLEGAKYIRAKELAMELDAMVKEKIEGLKRFIERKGQPATSSLQIKVRRG